MDTSDVCKILDNVEPGYVAAMEAAREALESEGFDWENRSENREPSSYYHAIGERIVDAIKEQSGGLADDYQSLAGLLFSEMLSDINRRELGEHYYESVTDN